jgi:hypothetical protein
LLVIEIIAAAMLRNGAVGRSLGGMCVSTCETERVFVRRLDYSRYMSKKRSENKKHWATKRHKSQQIDESTEAEQTQNVQPSGTINPPAKQTYIREELLLADLVEDHEVIADKKFVSCDLFGPAIVFISGEKTTITRCRHGAYGSMESLFWEIPKIPSEEYQIVGAIRLMRCQIEGCNFHHVGWAGTRAQLDGMRRQLALPIPRVGMRIDDVQDLVVSRTQFIGCDVGADVVDSRDVQLLGNISRPGRQRRP